MMKLRNWWNKPWTNGTYVKLTGFCWVISLIVGLGTYWFIKAKYIKQEETTEQEDEA